MEILKHSYVEIGVEELGSLGLLIADANLSKMHPEKMFLFMPATGSRISAKHIRPHDGWMVVCGKLMCRASLGIVQSQSRHHAEPG